MRRVFFLLLALTSTVLLRAADAVTLPTEIKLASGAVIRKVKPTRWEKDYVVVKHQGGVDPIRYAHMAPETRAAFLAARETELANKAAAEQAAIAAKNEKKKYTGQVFAATVGAGAYKFGNVLVEAFPLDYYLEFVESVKSHLPASFNSSFPADREETIMRAVQKASDAARERRIEYSRTDSDGRFEFSAVGEIFVICTATRGLSTRRTGLVNEATSWVVKPDGPSILLSNANEFLLKD